MLFYDNVPLRNLKDTIDKEMILCDKGGKHMLFIVGLMLLIFVIIEGIIIHRLCRVC